MLGCLGSFLFFEIDLQWYELSCYYHFCCVLEPIFTCQCFCWKQFQTLLFTFFLHHSTSVCVCTCVCACAHVHMHILTCMYTHTHIYIYKFGSNPLPISHYETGLTIILVKLVLVRLKTEEGIVGSWCCPCFLHPAIWVLVSPTGPSCCLSAT